MKNYKEINLLCFGNSLTYGCLVNKGYTDFLNDKLPSHVHIINAGVPGDTVLDGINRINNILLLNRPDITIIEFGVNDAFSLMPLNKFEDYYTSLIQRIPNIKILMIPHQLYDATDSKVVKPYYEKIKSLAESFNLDIIDLSQIRLSEDQLLEDMLHPNEQGYSVYCDKSYQILEKIIKF